MLDGDHRIRAVERNFLPLRRGIEEFEQLSTTRKKVMRVQDLDDARRRILERFRQKGVIDEKDIEPFTLE